MNKTNLKKLIKDNWKILSISFSYVNDKEEEKVNVVLGRGKKKKHIEVINDDEFTEYIFHFKEFQDEYGNNEFIYVEDLERYNKALEKLHQEG